MSKSFTQFRVDNITTTLPTTLEYGKEVYYKDASGNLTLWVGHEDGTAWPAVGYKEYVAVLTQTGIGAPVATVKINTLGGTTSYSRQSEGIYRAVNSAFVIQGDPNVAWRSVDDNSYVIETTQTGFVEFISVFEGSPIDGLNYLFTYRVYP